MIYTVTLTDKVDFAPKTEVEEILQNVRTILSTRKGSVPLDRDFGLSWAHIDKPYLVAQSLHTAEIVDAVGQYEPRAKVLNVKFNNNSSDVAEGILSPIVTVSIGDDEEEEEDL